MKAIQDLTVLITGATDGLGKDLALRFAKEGSMVLLHGRNPEKGQAVLEEIIQKTGNKNLRYFNADFASLQSVRDLGGELKKQYQNLDILINNAGIGSTKMNVRELSTDGYELTLCVNYLAPFLLTHLLLPMLHHRDTSKIINIASGSQQELNFDDLMLDHNYSGRKAYAQSKLALILFTFTLAGQSKDSTLRVNAIHPETRMNTKMVLDYYGSAESTIEAGTENVWYVATSTEVENLTGVYFNKATPAKADPQAYDPIARDKLYRLSKDLVKI
ncbi:SDR family NAD(P)-dependent oxidoreductase [Pedobacter sp. SYSU D00535]|uniref:SDR family NAD(P)-dependent oxidoreductase n=1 Tax=Pedobacter sp. SYSU D00535 TaxID=2810308 RepID=UPI001A95752C|nr:SDR family NAD(P)-dependent oxidoreductase [Pedobacter sp. SYSU D00535]